MLFVHLSVSRLSLDIIILQTEWLTGWQEASQTIDRMVYLHYNISSGCGHGSHAVREAAGRVHNAGQVQAGTNQVLDTKLFFSLTICSLCNTIYFQEPTGVRNILEELWAQSVCLSEHGWNFGLPKIKWVFSSILPPQYISKSHADNMVWVKKYMNGRCVKNKFERISVYYSGALVGERSKCIFVYFCCVKIHKYVSIEECEVAVLFLHTT